MELGRRMVATSSTCFASVLALVALVGCATQPAEAPSPTSTSISTKGVSKSPRPTIPQVTLYAEQVAGVRADCVSSLPGAKELTVEVGSTFLGRRVDVCLLNPNDLTVELPVVRIDPWPSSDAARQWIAEASPSQPVPNDGARIDPQEIMVWLVDGNAYKGRVVVHTS